MSCCGITCFVAILFLVANIYTMMCVDCKELKVDLYKEYLPPQLTHDSCPALNVASLLTSFGPSLETDHFG